MTPDTRRKALAFIRRVKKVSGRPPSILTVKTGFKIKFSEAEDLINEVIDEKGGG